MKKWISFNRFDCFVWKIDNFKLDKNVNFASYAGNCVRNCLIYYIKNNDRRKLKNFSLSNNINKEEDGFTYENVLWDSDNIELNFEDKERNNIIQKIIFNFDEREKNIVLLYFGFLDGKSIHILRLVKDIM